MTALERLSQIKTDNDFAEYSAMNARVVRIADIQEAVALAKANQPPSIDAMRFEAAKMAMNGILSDRTATHVVRLLVTESINYADALIAELQKPKL